MKGKCNQVSLKWNNEDKQYERGLQTHALLYCHFLALIKNLHLHLVLHLHLYLEAWCLSCARTIQVAVAFLLPAVHEAIKIRSISAEL